MSQSSPTVAAPREITDDEVSFYVENGWVKLENLISAELAAELLDGAKRLMETGIAAQGVAEEEEGDRFAKASKGTKVLDIGIWQDYHYPARDDHAEPFSSFVFSKELGRAAQRLLDKDVPVQYSADLLACKMPAGSRGGQATNWHQDFPIFPFDRYGSLAFWIALNDIPPERGTMRFLSKSQREGPIGRDGFLQGVDALELYPRLADRYETSPPLHLKPGDATVHHAAVIHSAPLNSTPDPRWTYIVAFIPGDTLYTGAAHHNFDGLGLEINKPIRHERFPIVYP
jgi:ectoine hydroxylase-related dioxygenase (phytanoyl-CoA dioxygenase family)